MKGDGKGGISRNRELRHFGLLDLVHGWVLIVDGRVLSGDYLYMRDLKWGIMRLAQGDLDRIVTGVLGISENGRVGPDRITGITSLLLGCGFVMEIHLGCVVWWGRGMSFVENCLLESRGGKEGTLEFLKPREARETGTWWIFTNGTSTSVFIFRSGLVDRGSLFLRGRIDSNLLLGKRDDLNRLLDTASALQLGFDGSPRSLYLRSK